MALEAVQAQAGHASIESTRIYLHLADDWLAAEYRRAAEVIDAQVFAGDPDAPPHRAGARAGDLAAGTSTTGSACAWSRHRELVATMGRYLDQIGCVAAAGQRRRRRPGAALVRRVPAPGAPEVTVAAQVDPTPHRGLQALAGRTARTDAPGSVTSTTIGPAARDAADVLRPDHRVGLGRRPGPDPDLPRRPAAPRRAAAQGPRRRATPRSCSAPPRPTRRLLAGVVVELLAPHRDAGRRAPRARQPTRSSRSAPRHWLHVPVGKLHNDRYIPLHPQLGRRCIDDWLAAPRRRQSSPLLLPTERGRPITATRVDPDASNAPPPPPGSATSTPTSCATPWPPRPSTAA